MKKLLVILLVAATTLQPALARAQFTAPANMAATGAREYYVGRDLGRPLVTVHLLNGVTQPGVYHVPMDTDVAELIAYAGGATERSDLGGITIRRGRAGTYHVTEVNLEKALREPTDLFKIQDHDVVQIDQKFNPEKSLAWVGIASAIASVLLSFFLVQDIERRKTSN